MSEHIPINSHGSIDWHGQPIADDDAPDVKPPPERKNLEIVDDVFRFMAGLRLDDHPIEDQRKCRDLCSELGRAIKKRKVAAAALVQPPKPKVLATQALTEAKKWVPMALGRGMAKDPAPADLDPRHAVYCSSCHCGYYMYNADTFCPRCGAR